MLIPQSSTSRFSPPSSGGQLTLSERRGLGWDWKHDKQEVGSSDGDVLRGVTAYRVRGVTPISPAWQEGPGASGTQECLRESRSEVLQPWVSGSHFSLLIDPWARLCAVSQQCFSGYQCFYMYQGFFGFAIIIAFQIIFSVGLHLQLCIESKILWHCICFPILALSNHFDKNIVMQIGRLALLWAS